MKIKKIKILMVVASLIITSSVVAAESNLDFLLYYGPIDYSDTSLREDGQVTGLYGSFYSNPNYKLEGAVEKSDIHYRSGFDLDQTDATLAFTYYSQNSRAYRFGIHKIFNNDYDTDNAITLFAGFNRYRPYEDSYGASLYYTRYPNSNKKVWQLSPKVTKYFGDHIITGTFFIEGKLNLISIIENSENNTYVSAEANLTWLYSAFQLSLGAWGGEQVYAVRNDGFSVYNLPYKHTGGIKFQAGYALTDNASLKLSIAQEQLIETGGQESEITIYMLSLGHTF